MRILLALDGSPSSFHARDLVASLPWPAGTELTLLTVVQMPVMWFPETAMAAGWLADAEAGLRAQAAAALADLAEPLAGRGWTIERRVSVGRAANVIIATADEVNADLIAIGSRGHGRMESMLLGSVSAEVADVARQSVLVARAGGVLRLLVATDGSDGANVIPDVLARWGSLQAVPADVLSVAPIGSPTYELLVSLYTLGDEPVARQREELLAHYRGYADAMARRLEGAGIRAVAEVRGGDPAREIVRAARERGADLIVTGSRSLHGLDRLLLGSVARNVLLHAHASVLVVRPSEASTPS